MTFSEKLKELRWSQAEISRRLNISEGQISRWGDSPPDYATAYVDQALELKAVRDAADGALRRTKR